MAKINIKIEGIPFEVEAGLTILEAAKECGFEIDVKPSNCDEDNYILEKKINKEY